MDEIIRHLWRILVSLRETFSRKWLDGLNIFCFKEPKKKRKNKQQQQQQRTPRPDAPKPDAEGVGGGGGENTAVATTPAEINQPKATCNG